MILKARSLKCWICSLPISFTQYSNNKTKTIMIQKKKKHQDLKYTAKIITFFYIFERDTMKILHIANPTYDSI